MESQVREQSKQLQAFWQRLQTGMLWRRRVPQVMQMSSVECGAACLAMILGYYGRQTDIEEIRERCGVGRDGLSALNIVKVARSYGLRVRAISLQENDFHSVRLPAIIHWSFNHFLVIERWSAHTVDVIDPAAGRLHLSAEEFESGFTGVVILLEPGVHFLHHRSSRWMNLRTYMVSGLKQAPWIFVQILAASLLMQLFGLAVPLFTKIVVDDVLPLHKPSLMLLLGVGILLLCFAQLVTALLRSLLLIYLQARMDMFMMLNFFEHLLALPLRFFQQRSNGDIIARLNSNIVIRDTLSNQLVSTLLDGSFVTVYLFILFWQSRLFGLLTLAIGVFQILLLIGTQRPLHELSMRELMAQGKALGYATESLAGIVSLKAAGAEQRAFQHWSNLFFNQLNISLRRNMVSSFMETATTLLQTFAPLVLLWVGTLQVLSGAMPVGTMLALNALAVAFLVPLASLVSSGQRLQLVRSHLDRLADVMEAEPEQDVQKVRYPSRLTGQVTLQNVWFRYGSQSPDVLKDITLTIKPGQKVAIVGRTGSGKSTLGKLILGLHVPARGEIFYDGIPLCSLNYQAVRIQFGVVMQEATIFSGTIRQNIAFNDPDMSMDAVVRAAQMAALHEDILTMPMGYETYVPEQGSALSGGQRQRLALARALAHSPALLLLDEATSSLDVVTEQLVEQAMSALTCTQIIIAHRLSTVRRADTILVLDDGVIVERGTHQELIEHNEYYAKLVRNQLMHEGEAINRPH